MKSLLVGSAFLTISPNIPHSLQAILKYLTNEFCLMNSVGASMFVNQVNKLATLSREASQII
ncbi:hypothetical protein SHVI106290_13345 [Shewanella violacea]|uniref:Uncharacterized protein n=1 Tax=Shewanella violacea (strain JCM 10179 / CIP 106290 / LMG 19151 / DSS12) TaxID=637905 RepID=D4ZDE4_SHEVD|nr:hypothetical protein SVI_0095 [Shewanella violacea DSS12]